MMVPNTKKERFSLAYISAVAAHAGYQVADVIVPRLLIVVLLPESESQWLCHSEQELQLRHCGYWLSLLEYTETENTNNITVTIPRTQTFNSEQLTQLMDRANRGEPL